MKKPILLLVPCVLLSGCLSANPHDFECGRYLEDVMTTYPAAPGIDGMGRFAGGDYGENKSVGSPSITFDILSEREAVAASIAETILRHEQEIEAANKDAEESGLIAASDDANSYDAVLILSGGGQWGAFGAGALSEWQDSLKSPNPETKRHGAKGEQLDAIPGVPAFRAITGISTGALQAVFASSGDFDAVVEAYSIDRQEDVVIDRGIYEGAIRQGAQLDTAPLVERLRSRLCPDNSSDFACPRLKSIAESPTTLLIGLVDGETGDLKVVNVTQMLKGEYGKERLDAAVENELANCVTGVAMASAAVPAQLRPVRIDRKAYVDGGVRAAVFSDLAGKFAESYATIKSDDKNKGNGGGQKSKVEAPAIFVVRNGPTVIAPPDKKKDDPALADISEKPSIDRIALRSYSTIVNQNEMSSVTELARIYKSPIYFISADGFNNADYNKLAYREGNCTHPALRDDTDAEAFNHEFMQCLIKWGRDKYNDHGWTMLVEDLPDSAATPDKAEGQ